MKKSQPQRHKLMTTMHLNLQAFCDSFSTQNAGQMTVWFSAHSDSVTASRNVTDLQMDGWVQG
jgi:hypothetical protein